MNDELPTPSDFLKAVYCNESLPLNTRLRAAMAAAPFCHPKLTAVAMVGKEDMAEALARAIERTQKVITSRPVDVIEAKPEEPEAQVEPPDHSKPFPVDHKSRWRRF